MKKKFEETGMLKLILIMGIPPIFSMLMQSLYNIIDGMFVAKVSSDAFTAINLLLPLQQIILAIAVGTGIGVNSVISRKFGEKNYEEVNSASFHGLFLSLFHYVCLAGLSLLFVKPFFSFFTDNLNVIELGVQYTNIVMIFSFGFMIHLVAEKVLQASGNMIWPMIFQLIGCIINIILDYIFIMKLNMGISGAAYATIIGQIFAGSISVIYLFFINKGFKLRFKGFKFNMKCIIKIYEVGIPSSLMMMASSLLIAGLNKILGSLGEVYINALGSYFKLQTFVIMPASGLIQGLRPIMGYQYGCKNKKRFDEAFKIGLKIVMGILIVGMILFLIGADLLVGIFDNGKEVALCLRIISLGFIGVSINFVICALFESVGNGKVSMLISLTRQLIIVLGLSFIFIYIFKWNEISVWVSFVLAEYIAVGLSLFMLRKFRIYDQNFI